MSGRWPRPLTSWPIAVGVVVIWHAGWVALYAAHRAVSPLPFRSKTTETLLYSPALPSAHAAAATVLLLALFLATGARLRGLAGFLSVFVCAVHAGLLTWAAQNRYLPGSPHARGALGAAFGAWVIALIALLVLLQWGNDDDESR